MFDRAYIRKVVTSFPAALETLVVLESTTLNYKFRFIISFFVKKRKTSKSFTSLFTPGHHTYGGSNENKKVNSSNTAFK